MTDRFKNLLDTIPKKDGMDDPWHWVFDNYEELKEALTLATEAEQLQKRLVELENLIAQANKKIQWYERTEATND